MGIFFAGNPKKVYFCLPKRDAAIKTLSYIVRFLAGFAISIVLGLVLFTALPATQRWLAAKVSNVLSTELQTEVEIQRARIGLFNRVVLDDILVLDQQKDTLLSATRLSVKVPLSSILSDKLRITSVQLFGYDIQLRRSSPDEPYNFQFIVDYFASEDSTTTPLDLTLQQVVVRRGRFSHNILSEPTAKHFTPAHFQLNDLRLRLSIDSLTNNHISSKISELSFNESISGLTLEDLQGALSADFSDNGKISAGLHDFHLQLPSSELHIPDLTIQASLTTIADSTSLQMQTANGTITGNLTPSELAPLVPQLAPFGLTLVYNTDFSLDNNCVHVSGANIQSEQLALELDGSMNLPLAGQPLQVAADIRELQLRAPFTNQVLTLLADSGAISPDLAATLERMGDIAVKGTGSYSPALTQGNFHIQTSIGNLELKGDIAHGDLFKGNLKADKVRPLLLFENPESLPLDNLSLIAEVQGSIARKSLDAQLNGSMKMGDEPLDLMQADLSLSPNEVSGQLRVSDNHYSGKLEGLLKSPLPLLSGNQVLNNLTGEVRIKELAIHNEESDYDLNEFELTIGHDDEQRQSLTVDGDFISAEFKGKYSYLTLAQSLQHALNRALPSLVPALSKMQKPSTDQVDFELHLFHSDELFALTGLDLQLPEPAYVQGSFDGTTEHLSLKMDCPYLIYGSQDIRALSLIAHEVGDSLDLFLSAQRMIEEGPIDVSLIAHGADDVLNSLIRWDDHNTPVQQGELSTSTHFRRTSEGGLAADIAFLPTQIIVADTVWNVHPARIQFANGVAQINDFQISQLGRHLKVDGSISSQPSDTLYADLEGVNLQYVFGIIDFHDVEFRGLATGKVKISNFSDIPRVDGLLNVEDFTMNDGLLGRLALDIGFGRKDDRAIDVDGIIREPSENRLSHVVGIIKPGREEGRGMELHIYADHLNTYFINEFTEGIFDRVEGKASGYAHIYGPFSELDLEGEIALDSISLGIPLLGTRYHTHGGDSLHLHPGGIRLSDIVIYDQLHKSDNRHHSGILSGELRYEHFENLRYNFTISAEDLLGYDFRTFGDQSFCGTAIANGNVTLQGQPGRLNVNINCSPTAGTVFTYNVTTPETTTDNAFITFHSKNADRIQDRAAESSSEADEEEDDEPMDIYINFDLDITPVAQMRLLMDSRSEDYINLWGNGHIRATFYNKGRFQMYGTYRVDHGNYRLSLQDFIRKEFLFDPGSTITFGGNPMYGDLNLRAIYTVPSVSLNDLSAGSNFSSSTVRVNCIMNIGGRAENPQISFDFDIPNVNEDEKQMVRSLISTDEERNMQVIYLLGIGRFYTLGLGANENQTNTAMQGLLSSTISGQLNNMLSNAIGSKDWNFGTNLSTGQLGWQDMDVEGSLSGRLLNNRLLINGTFGYRDTPVANTNFIGDFDVRWLVNKSGTISLKAYSETNDRYFTKSALTTQGVGIQLKKEFNSFGELFRRRK